jgi:hypothetical protein
MGASLLLLELLLVVTISCSYRRRAVTTSSSSSSSSSCCRPVRLAPGPGTGTPLRRGPITSGGSGSSSTIDITTAVSVGAAIATSRCPRGGRRPSQHRVVPTRRWGCRRAPVRGTAAGAGERTPLGRHHFGSAVVLLWAYGLRRERLQHNKNTIQTQ